MCADFTDRLGPDATDRPGFDRFYFNMHGPQRLPAFFMIGAGIYPEPGLVDGYMVAVVGDEQRNLRTSDAIRAESVGPLEWEVIEPLRTWRLFVGPNPTGIEVDVVWRARAPHYEVDRYVVPGQADFAHYFQSGRYEGQITIDGGQKRVDGWLGQRDRSRGRRGIRDRLGLHLWIQIQFENESIGFLYNENRAGEVTHVEGAVMREDGKVIPVTGVRHALSFNDDLELLRGRFEIDVQNGPVRRLTMNSTGPGLFMAGGGYDGWHGVDHGPGAVEHDVWPLDGSRTPRNLKLGITDALCTFHEGRREGSGISEYALTRSPRYAYAPTLR